MKYVEIYKLQNDGSQTVLATCSLAEGGEAVCVGEGPFAANLASEGISNYSAGPGDADALFFPKDGLKFLEQLKFNFKSGYLNASDVMEK